MTVSGLSAECETLERGAHAFYVTIHVCGPNLAKGCLYVLIPLLNGLQALTLFAHVVGELVDSSELVPGDLVDLAESSLHTFPADMVLLSGDAIVNESMLTGESVPVSKIPIDDKAVQEMTSVGGDVPPDLGKHFMFCGTRIVRIRKLENVYSTSTGGEAVGMVVRTGFNTTKGALVRSMLFPKPMGWVINTWDESTKLTFFDSFIASSSTGIPSVSSVSWAQLLAWASWAALTIS